MEKYDYYKNVKADIKDALDEFFNYNDINDFDDYDELYQKVNDNFYDSDSVTGNASGSYTCNTWTAEENICHNMDLLYDAEEEYGGDVTETIKRGAEVCDVVIRIYVMTQVLDEVLKDYISENYSDWELENMD